MAIRLVTFDAHGTLIRPHPGVGAIYARCGADYGFDRDADDLDARFGEAFRATVAEWPVPYGADDEDARAFWIRVVERTFDEPLPNEVAWACYDTFAEAASWQVLPGAREALALVDRAGIPAAVVSNFDCRLPPLLQDLGLGPFAAVVVSAQVGAAKPAPAPLLAACAVVGCRPDEVLHIGDSLGEDGAMAAACGAAWLNCAAAGGIPLDGIARMLRS